MFRTLKFKGKEDSFWLSGCWHGFHKQPFIWQKRGYNSIEEHTWGISKIINDLVKPTDTLFNLGDGFLNSSPEQVKDFLSKINCRNIIYLLGNHESSMYRIYREQIDGYIDKDQELYPVKWNNVTFIDNYAEISINGQPIVLSHFPLAIWNYMQHGSWNCHSHNHSSFKQSLPNDLTCKRLDCGWDVFGRPVSYKEVKDIMAKKNIAILDHHNS